jgi:dethiobiotin synthetase
MARSIFITATDTDAGKTWVTTNLIRSMLAAGIQAKALKPVACGLDTEGNNEDITALLNIQRLKHVEDINLYCFQQPDAPSLAAAAENRSINPNRLITWCRKKAEETDICLIEGVGGLMVPLTNDYLVCDWIEDIPEAEIWLVVGCRLGSINHALLTLDKLKNMGRSPARIILNATNPVDNHRLEPTQRAITPFLTESCQIQTLNHGAEIDAAADISL